VAFKEVSVVEAWASAQAVQGVPWLFVQLLFIRRLCLNFKLQIVKIRENKLGTLAKMAVLSKTNV